MPLIFQAGASKAGIALAGAHAEGLYCGSIAPETTNKYVQSICASAAASGRSPKDIKAFAGISPFIGRTMEEAQAKYDRAWKHAGARAGLSRFGGYTSIDLSQFPLDEPFEHDVSKPAANAVGGILKSFRVGDGTNAKWTPRKLGELMSCGGMYPQVVGTPEMVADFMEKWAAESGIDGKSTIPAVLAPC